MRNNMLLPMKIVKMNKQTVPLIGFALKSKEAVLGFEAVRRAAKKKKIALVLVHSKLSGNSVQKLAKFLNRTQIPLFQTSVDVDWINLWGIHTHKILGITRGDISPKILQNLKSGV